MIRAGRARVSGGWGRRGLPVWYGTAGIRTSPRRALCGRRRPGAGKTRPASKEEGKWTHVCSPGCPAVTPEEEAILRGERRVQDLYSDSADFTIESRKMIGEALVRLRCHTRFIEFPGAHP